MGLKNNLRVCPTCGADIFFQNGIWVCKSCDNTFTEKTVETEVEALRSLLDEQKQERVANLRRALYEAITAEYTNSVEICRLCAEIKKLLPDDFMANFFDIANRGTIKQIAVAIRSINTEKYPHFVDLIFRHILNSLCSDYILPLQNMLERAFKNTDLARFEKYSTMLSEEAARVDSGIYETNLPRDVFVAYSSRDMDKVEELVQTLEENGLSCFVAVRNLRHGRGAVENYQKALEQAMDNCRSVVFVSSPASRSMSCDALKHELPYIRRCDLQNAPGEYRNNYAAIPEEYKKPRVEYRVAQSSRPTGADLFLNEFFGGYEYVYSPKEVADRVFRAITRDYIPTAPAQSPFIADPEPTQASPGVSSLLKRAFIFLEDCEWEQAREYFEKVLDIDPENAEAYLGKLMLELRLTSREMLSRCNEPFDNNSNYRKLMRFGSPALIKEIGGYNNQIIQRNTTAKNEAVYQSATAEMNAAKSEQAFRAAADKFNSISGYRNAAALARTCLSKAGDCHQSEIYERAKRHMAANTANDYIKAAALFQSILSYRDAEKMYKACQELSTQYTAVHKEIENASAARTALEKKKKDAKSKMDHESSLVDTLRKALQNTRYSLNKYHNKRDTVFNTVILLVLIGSLGFFLVNFRRLYGIGFLYQFKILDMIDNLLPYMDPAGATFGFGATAVVCLMINNAHLYYIKDVSHLGDGFGSHFWSKGFVFFWIDLVAYVLILLFTNAGSMLEWVFEMIFTLFGTFGDVGSLIEDESWLGVFTLIAIVNFAIAIIENVIIYFYILSNCRKAKKIRQSVDLKDADLTKQSTALQKATATFDQHSKEYSDTVSSYSTKIRGLISNYTATGQKYGLNVTIPFPTWLK